MTTLSFKSATANYDYFLGAATPGADQFPYPDDLVGLYFFGTDQERSVMNHGTGPDLTVTGAPVYNDFSATLAPGSYFDTGFADQNQQTSILICRPITNTSMGAYQDVSGTDDTASDGHFISVQPQTGGVARQGMGLTAGSWSQLSVVITDYIANRSAEFFMLAGVIDKAGNARRIAWGHDGTFLTSTGTASTAVAAAPARNVKIGGYNNSLWTGTMEAVGAMLYHRPLALTDLQSALTVWSNYAEGKVVNGMAI